MNTGNSPAVEFLCICLELECYAWNFNRVKNLFETFTLTENLKSCEMYVSSWTANLIKMVKMNSYIYTDWFFVWRLIDVG